MEVFRRVGGSRGIGDYVTSCTGLGEKKILHYACVSEVLLMTIQFTGEFRVM
jgi:hypothetical protein